MQPVNCVICGQNNTKVISKKGILEKGGEPLSFNNVICLNCGLVFINPRPDEVEYRELYKKYAKLRHSFQSQQDVLAYIKTTEKKSKSENITTFLRPYIKSGARALDIGSGVGLVGHALQDILKLEVLSIEPDPLLAKTASEHYKLSVFAGTIDEFRVKFLNEKFDLIILHHVFEHFSDPIAKLHEIETMLTTGGMIYIEVPNILDFKKPYHQFFDLLHPYSYSLTTLSCILNLGGFRILAWNKQKRWRNQVLVIRKNDPRKPLEAKELNAENIVQKTTKYLHKKRMLETIFGFLRWPH